MERGEYACLLTGGQETRRSGGQEKVRLSQNLRDIAVEQPPYEV
jgi:hypothetical protein